MSIKVCHRRRAMGTWFEVLLLGEDEEHLDSVAEAALDEVERIERLLSRFDPTSEIARINRDAARRRVIVSFEVLEVIESCRHYWDMTCGYFDPTAGVDGPGSFADVCIDAGSRTISFAQPDLAFDLGGYGKGYALDRAAELLREYGVGSALIHGGTSSILALGTNENGKGWPIGLRNPFSDDDEMDQADTLSLRDCGFSCSAVFRPGELTSDIVDPHTGRSLTAQAACAVVVCSALEAEVLSPALLSMGKDGAEQHCRKTEDRNLRVAWIELQAGLPTLDWLAG